MSKKFIIYTVEKVFVLYEKGRIKKKLCLFFVQNGNNICGQLGYAIDFSMRLSNLNSNFLRRKSSSYSNDSTI